MVRCGVQVEPDGETEVEYNESVTHRSADAVDDGEAAEEAPQVAQVDGESATMYRNASIAGERECAGAHVRSTAADKENDQRTETVDSDIPEKPPEPPPPPSSSAKPTQRRNDPPSVELKGERFSHTSCDDRLTGGDMNVSGASGGDEDTRNVPKKPRDASEREHKRLEQVEGGNSPMRPPDNPDEPSGDASVTDNVQSHQGRPRADGNARRGHLGQLEAKGDVEVDSGGQEVINRAEYDGTLTMSDGNAHVAEMNALRRYKDPGGSESEQEVSSDEEVDWGRPKVIDGGGYDGNSGQTDGATSGARRDSKRVKTDPLADTKASQRRHYKHDMTDAPRPSAPPPAYPRSPTDYLDPPRRRGRIKLHPREVSQTRARKTAHHVIRAYRGHIGQIGRTRKVIY
ncbi:hypothetical protein HD554DRAFT_2313462 [Boletus coccyginus]|nr:hypothetical protein HD554DRAFT_2313462 [Boletus coccyginus]